LTVNVVTQTILLRRDEMEGHVMSDDFETITRSIADAFTRQDAEGIAGYYTDNAQVLPPDAPLVEGREGLIAMLNATFAGGGRSLRMETISRQENGDLLVQVGSYVMGITAGGQSFDDPGKFVSVYARQPDGGLLLTVTCFNRDAPPPTA
jgi:ketosteroid isomerase-like protein